MVLRSDSVTNKDRERVSTIRQQGKHAADLTQKMLDFCGMSILQRQVVDLNQFVDAFSLEVIATLPDAIKVSIESASKDILIRIDPDRLHQALHNIFINAQDAMPDGGEILVKLDTAMLDMDGKQNFMACITISDTGQGIMESVRPHIFEPFFTTRSPLRTGLGLSQALGIIKQHGGHMDVESTAGKGTSVMIYLPTLENANINTLIESKTEIATGEGQTILVLVSDSALRDALISSLEMLNYHAIGVGNENSAIEVLEDESVSIDLVLSDLSVSAFQGLETLQTLKKHGLQTKVVFLATLDFIDEITRLGLEEMVFGLEKPIDLEELARGIDRAFK
jgi:CheY-like chemotaxis protein